MTSEFDDVPPDSVITKGQYEYLSNINSNWRVLQGAYEDVTCPSCGGELKIRVGRHGPWTFCKPNENTSLQHRKKDGDLCHFTYGDVKVGV